LVSIKPNEKLFSSLLEKWTTRTFHRIDHVVSRKPPPLFADIEDVRISLGVSTMTMLINDPQLEENLIESRKRRDADRWDEVWEGVYVVSPLPNNEHQKILTRLVFILEESIGLPELGEVFPSVNLSDQPSDWKYDFRAPDVAVFLKSGKAVDCGTYWRGPADFLVEIVSPYDRSYEKLPFYEKLGVVELLIVDRDPWKLELHQRIDDRLQKTGESNLENGAILQSRVVSLSFQLVPGKGRPQIAVEHSASGKKWTV
jgi:hypothetical protein